MKRSGFKKKPTKPMKRTPLRRVSKTKRNIDKSRTKSKGYKVPSWFMSIPVGSHGSNPTQKRYWKVVSNLVRQRDFKKYKGRCVSCKTVLADWKEGQSAHFKRYTACNSYFKFNELNCALSCPICNHNDDGVVGHAFGEELKRRYGNKHLDWVEKENKKWHGVKMENHIIVERVQKLLEENPWFVLP